MMVGLFETLNTLRAALVEIVKRLLQTFLTNQLIRWLFMKDKGANLTILVTALSSVDTCWPLGMIVPYVDICFGHGMSWACQYTTTDEKVSGGMSEVSILKARGALSKTITWTKKSKKGRQKWGRVCIDVDVPSRTLKTLVKTRFASKVVLFQE